MSIPPLTLPGLELDPPAPVARATDPEGALHELFGFADFRPGQRAAVGAALADRDALIVMPTGSGKSLCYQLPALMRSDLTVVVSPLVSLMQDQVEALRHIAPGRVALVNAQQDSAANRRALAAAQRGDLRLLYVAPERLHASGFAERLQGASVGLFVVDEAHCVSQWGHDFRPDYFRLADAARWLGARAILASTATATPRVAADICDRLGLRDPVRVATGFDRPNLSFAVTPVKTKEEAHRGVADALAAPGALPAIVYAGTRAECERLASRLARSLDRTVLPYHAGLPRDVRANHQRRFMNGEVPVVVATNAFGMGVDKPDVRTVCHESVPGSLEAYYQEAGRAGRDGLPARCLLFAAARDKGLHVFFIERSVVEDGALTAVARRLVARAEPGGRYDVGMDELLHIVGDGEFDRVRSILGHLARADVIRPSPSPPDRAWGAVVGEWDAAAREACRVAAREGVKARWEQYREVWGWVEGGGCRRTGILRHFGDPSDPQPTGPCCDVCDPSLKHAPAPRRRAPQRLGPLPLTGHGLDAAILCVVAGADPPIGRTRLVEILRGGRSRDLVAGGWDGLREYGTYGHLQARVVTARVDALLADGTLRSTPGRRPKLVVA
ncbi:MAG: ATP-dependent helicase RecQ [Solirubrobacteraceae bacterium]|nr:ATP-dependent helicase RecQ [Solirubrobacteraceae bacterium]